MRVLFMGTPTFAVPSLERLARSRHTVVRVLTQPDRPQGRGRHIDGPPVKAVAARLGIAVMQPEDANAEDALAVAADAGADIGVVVAYGGFLKRAFRSLFPRECINLHPSLLPKFRGADPIRWALYTGETETGISIIYLSDKMDAGDIILQRTVSISESQNYGTLAETLARVGADVVVEALDAIERGEAVRRPQSDGEATYAPKFKPEEKRIDWSEAGEAVVNRIRTFAPEPGAETGFRGRDLKILRARYERKETGDAAPGTIIQIGREGSLRVATGNGEVLIDEVQPAGRRPMGARDFLNGYHPEAGERLA
jgi:methionyl-tRNA formyltransferase